MTAFKIIRPGNVIRGSINLPFSKSIFNRALILEALSGGHFKVQDDPDTDDAVLMKMLLAKSLNSDTDLTILLDAHNSGTVFRFLTAYLCLKPGTFLLTGSSRMKRRPVFPLVTALRDLGADITYLESEGYPPLMIRGKADLRRNETWVDSSLSSQFLSALLLIAPFMEYGVKVHLPQKPASESYIELTVHMLASMGINVERTTSSIEVDRYIPRDQIVTVEKDWSSSAFWYELVALDQDATLGLAKLDTDSVQGDRILPSLFDLLGVKTTRSDGFVRISNETGMLQKNIVRSFNDNPDLALPFACTCAALGINLTLQGISHLRIKESDRISSLTMELGKIGCKFFEEKDDLEMNSSLVKFYPGIVFDSHDDHRVAMSLAPLALKAGEIILQNPEVVSKSYPDFWKELAKIGFRIVVI